MISKEHGAPRTPEFQNMEYYTESPNAPDWENTANAFAGRLLNLTMTINATASLMRNNIRFGAYCRASDGMLCGRQICAT